MRRLDPATARAIAAEARERRKAEMIADGTLPDPTKITVQDLIRRAALAIKESRSTDYFVLAKIALEHAVRTEADVALLIAPPKASPAAMFAAPQSFPVVNIAR